MQSLTYTSCANTSKHTQVVAYIIMYVKLCVRLPSLVPRPLPERVRAWYTLFAHASNFPCDFPYIFQDTLLSTWAMYGT